MNNVSINAKQEFYTPFLYLCVPTIFASSYFADIGMGYGIFVSLVCHHHIPLHFCGNNTCCSTFQPTKLNCISEGSVSISTVNGQFSYSNS